MESAKRFAAPEGGGEGGEPEELPIDPEIEALLGFDPVVRKVVRGDGWTAERQRRFVAYVALLGSRTLAAEAVGREVAGVSKLCRADGGESFEAACEAALALYQKRNAVRQEAGFKARSARRGRNGERGLRQPGQVENELGEWEDEASLIKRADDARHNIARKIVNCRRLFLQEISKSPGKRAAFEILTELPVDWERAARLQPQPDEPWRKPNMRQGDMVLTAEAGWMSDLVPYGPEKVAQLRAAIDAHRAEQGLEPVDWGGGVREGGEG
jgi:hypothetical protein